MIDLAQYPNYLTPAEAAFMADVTPRTIIAWCDRYPDLGVRVVGRWRIRPDVLNRLLAGHMPSDAGVRHVHDR